MREGLCKLSQLHDVSAVSFRVRSLASCLSRPATNHTHVTFDVKGPGALPRFILGKIQLLASKAGLGLGL